MAENDQSPNSGQQMDVIKEMNMRQNIHKINQINKMVYARASSEPPQPLHQSGVLNSKSLILPVEEENPSEDHLNSNITSNDMKN